MPNDNVTGHTIPPNASSGDDSNSRYNYLLERIYAVEQDVAVIKEKLLHVPTRDDLARVVDEVRRETNKKWYTWAGLLIGAITMVAAIIAAANSFV